MLARCRVHEVSQEWGCEWGSSYMNESIHSVSSHDCRFLPNRMRGGSLLITPKLGPFSNKLESVLSGISPKWFGALSLRLSSLVQRVCTSRSL